VVKHRSGFGGDTHGAVVRSDLAGSSEARARLVKKILTPRFSKNPEDAAGLRRLKYTNVYPRFEEGTYHGSAQLVSPGKGGNGREGKGGGSV